MTTHRENNKRIAINTLMLYFRQILILLISLYTVRIVLDALGIEDYGIYNVVGGIVSLFSFLGNSMASATQRFFSFALGKNDLEKLKRIFTVNLIIYLGIAVVALVMLETAGYWFVVERLKIPEYRFNSAVYLYHFSVFTFLITILTTPFRAIIIAHEDMHIYAYVSIIEAILKIGVVFLLIYMPGDKLELYGVLVFLVAFFNALIYLFICIKRYDECQFKRFLWEKTLLFEIANFTGWTLFGQFTSVARNQAITILINQFFNPMVVAARAVANNVGQINVFASSFNTSLYPPIIKAYAGDDKKYMFSLVFNGSKITFFLLWVLAFPIFIELDAILNFWLKNPPTQALLFTRLALIEVLINSISLPIMTAARAPGKMRYYELSLGIIQIAILVISWVVLRNGGEAYLVYVIAIIANIIMFAVRLIIVKGLTGLPIINYVNNVLIPILGVVILSSLPAFLLKMILPSSIIFTFLIIVIGMLSASICMYYLGLNKAWRNKFKVLIRERIRNTFLSRDK